MRSHWAHVGLAVALGWAAALTKEIGITIVRRFCFFFFFFFFFSVNRCGGAQGAVHAVPCLLAAAARCSSALRLPCLCHVRDSPATKPHASPE